MGTKKYRYCLECKFFVERDYGSTSLPYGFSRCSFIDRYYGNNKRKMISFGNSLKKRWERLNYTVEYLALINLEDN